jgi:hypothetical protein
MPTLSSAIKGLTANKKGMQGRRRRVLQTETAAAEMPYSANCSL